MVVLLETHVLVNSTSKFSIAEGVFFQTGSSGDDFGGGEGLGGGVDDKEVLCFWGRGGGIAGALVLGVVLQSAHSVGDVFVGRGKGLES